MGTVERVFFTDGFPNTAFLLREIISYDIAIRMSGNIMNKCTETPVSKSNRIGDGDLFIYCPGCRCKFKAKIRKIREPLSEFIAKTKVNCIMLRLNPDRFESCGDEPCRITSQSFTNHKCIDAPDATKVKYMKGILEHRTIPIEQCGDCHETIKEIKTGRLELVYQKPHWYAQCDTGLIPRLCFNDICISYHTSSSAPAIYHKSTPTVLLHPWDTPRLVVCDDCTTLPVFQYPNCICGTCKTIQANYTFEYNPSIHNAYHANVYIGRGVHYFIVCESSYEVVIFGSITSLSELCITNITPLLNSITTDSTMIILVEIDRLLRLRFKTKTRIKLSLKQTTPPPSRLLRAPIPPVMDVWNAKTILCKSCEKTHDIQLKYETFLEHIPAQSVHRNDPIRCDNDAFTNFLRTTMYESLYCIECGILINESVAKKKMCRSCYSDYVKKQDDDEREYMDRILEFINQPRAVIDPSDEEGPSSPSRLEPSDSYFYQSSSSLPVFSKVRHSTLT